MNRVILTGTLTHDPDIRHTSSSQVTTLRVQTVETFTHNGQQKQRKDTHTVKLWGKRSVIDTLRRGDRVEVDGQLRNDSYEHKGEKKWKTEVQAQSVEKVSGGASEEQLPNPNGYGETPPDDDSIPF